MSHLRALVAALVDGELGDDERERALVHLASCATCRAEVAAHRAVKDRLAGLAAAPPPPGLLAELRRMAEPGEPMVPTRRPVGGSRPPAVPVDGRPSPRPSARATARTSARPGAPATRRRTRGRRIRTTLSAGALVVATTLVTAFAVGGEAPPAQPTVRPDLDMYVVEHARTSRAVPFAELPADVVGVSLRTVAP